MVKLKNPLLSFDAQGSVGDALCLQRSAAGTIARKKPMPSDPYSLAQAYHRWLYQDYLALWNTLTPAQKFAYRQAGGLKKNTAIGEFMRPRLGLLPDLAGVWHLDEEAGAIARDTTPNENDGAIIGALSQRGVIAMSRWFDGVNDRVTVPDSPTINLTADFTIMGIVNPSDLAAVRTVFAKSVTADRSWWCEVRHTTGDIWFLVYDSLGAWHSYHSGLFLTLGWHHIAVVHQPTVALTVYLDGIPSSEASPIIDTRSSGADFQIGCSWPGAQHWKGNIDEVRLYNRALTEAEIDGHIERSYRL